MQCRNCGTEIADKALVCYKCGTATSVPTVKPPSKDRTRSSAGLVASILALVIIGLFAVYLTRTMAPGSSSLSWAIVVFAVIVVALRGFARRIRR
jgi:hypothetical protein